MEPEDPLKDVLDLKSIIAEEIEIGEADYLIIKSDETDISLPNSPDLLEASLEFLKTTLQSGAYKVLTNPHVQKGVALIYILNAPRGVVGRSIEAIMWKLLTSN